MVQVVTGVALAFTYVPTPDSAYEACSSSPSDALLGSIVRGIHFWGASAMVLLVFIHMAAGLSDRASSFRARSTG